jgi:hypothetical protein
VAVDRIIVDASDLSRLAAAIDESAATAQRDIRPVVQRGALNIKRGAQKRVAGIKSAPNYGRTITYDSHETPAGSWAEIGPETSKQVGGGVRRTPGNLGWLFEDGTPTSAPIPHMRPALEEEAPRFERALEAVVEKALDL